MPATNNSTKLFVSLTYVTYRGRVFPFSLLGAILRQGFGISSVLSHDERIHDLPEHIMCVIFLEHTMWRIVTQYYCEQRQLLHRPSLWHLSRTRRTEVDFLGTKTFLVCTSLRGELMISRSITGRRQACSNFAGARAHNNERIHDLTEHNMREAACSLLADAFTHASTSSGYHFAGPFLATPQRERSVSRWLSVCSIFSVRIFKAAKKKSSRNRNTCPLNNGQHVGTISRKCNPAWDGKS